jgi:endonuclease/exonuclease/phosphatase family metal-dependent hydrolase
MMYSTSVRALLLGAALVTAAAAPASAQTNSNGDIILHAHKATRTVGAWSLVSDSTAADGVRLANPDAGAAKLTAPLASPASYFEMTFNPEAGRGYHLWIRARAQNDAWTNDSVYVQFDGSLNASGSPVYRIGTTSATTYSLEEYNGAGEAAWGWQDNGYGVNVLGDTIYFSGTTQTIRVQTREDGLSIDQIVLSPVTYATRAPGAAKYDTTILPEPASTSTTTASTSTTSSGSTSITWTGLVNATASGGTIKKVSGCGDCADAGGVSQQQLTSGSISFTVPTGQRLVVGLGRDTSTSTSYAIDYAFSFGGTSSWEIREGGAYRTEGPFAAGDVFKLSIEGTALKYYRNGALVYTSPTAVSGALVADTSLLTIGATVQMSSSSTTSSTTTGTTSTGSTSTSTTTSGTTLRVLQWNTHHGGYGTDGIYDTNRVANWIVYMNAPVVMLNEIERYTSWGNENQPEVYKNLLQKYTGKTWYYVFAQEFGQWSSNGKGNLILSTYPLSYTTAYELVHNYDRSIGLATITVNNRPITLMLTHLDPYDATLRLTQATEVTGWAAPQPENRIITGDMNAWPDQASIAQFNSLYYDSWAVAASKGTAYAFPGNNGETKNGRIDYIFYSKGSSSLTVVDSRVYDTRDANGYMPSDHRPVVTTFTVK